MFTTVHTWVVSCSHGSYHLYQGPYSVVTGSYVVVMGRIYSHWFVLCGVTFFNTGMN